MAAVIKRIPLPPGVHRQIASLNILRAVQGTTGIEGTELSEDEVGQIIAAPQNKPILPKGRGREEQEVRNADELMHFIADLLIKKQDTMLNEDLVRKFHEITTQKIDYPNNEPGRYRNHGVTAGSYNAPPAASIPLLMQQFMEWFNSGERLLWDPIVRAIVAHFYVVSIHPFGDGNGRTSRGVESFLLFKADVNSRGFYSLANYYYRNRSEYVALLDHVRFESDGDLTPFVRFSLRGLAEELTAVHEEILDQVRLIAYRDLAREVLQMTGRLSSSAGERMFLFLLELQAEPVSIRALRNGEIPLARFYRNVTSRTLARDIAFLREQGLIVVDSDELRANLELMTLYTAPAEMAKQARSSRKQRTPKRRR
jgi:Fic family protein